MAAEIALNILAASFLETASATLGDQVKIDRASKRFALWNLLLAALHSEFN